MQKMLDYAAALALHNERTWFHANKPAYQEALAEFSDVIRLLLAKIHAVNPAINPNLNPKDLMYRVARDIRFSKNKEPYNPSFRMHIGPAGKKPLPAGYCIQIQPENSYFYCGMHIPLPAATKAVRDYLVANSAGFESIINDPGFKDHFVLVGEKLKKVPKGYDPEHPLAEYLKHKTWDINDPIPDEKLVDNETFTDYIVSRILLVQPLLDYLNRAIEGIDLPERM